MRRIPSEAALRKRMARAVKVARLEDDLVFELPWHTGDVAWVASFAAMHGRRTCIGTRKVLASLIA